MKFTIFLKKFNFYIEVLYCAGYSLSTYGMVPRYLKLNFFAFIAVVWLSVRNIIQEDQD
jgi:hypothetical protein